MKRRNVLKGMAGATASAVFGSISRQATAQIGFMNLDPMPVGYVAHGSPMLLADNVRGPELHAWGASLPKPKGIVVVTPHYRARQLEVGHVGEGFAMYNLPDWIAKQTPKVTYRTPSNAALAARVRELLRPLNGADVPVAKDRPGFDHTTWIPLFHMFPQADIPVVEVALPFANETVFFAMGQALRPLRDEGIFILASGTITHNLAAADMTGHGPAPAWSTTFDAWAKKSLVAGNAGALLDWRAQAPNADIAHPDDGGHFRVLMIALGAVVEKGTFKSAKFPVEGFELGNLSKRCVQLI